MSESTAVATINPFGNLPKLPSTASAANTDASRAVAEVQAAMMIARMNPRDPVASMDRILNACTRPSLAESAIYSFARGGSDVSGPSIRLAEAMAQQWGNIKTSVRELEQQSGMSVVQAIAWDLETGYQCDKVFHVAHERHTKSGVKKLTDPRDVYELVANQAARRLRACILAVIPGDVTEAAVKQCETTLHTSADASPETVQKMVAAFAAFGVTKEQIEARIQRRLDAIQPAQVVALKKIYASLRDGMSTPADWFAQPDVLPGASATVADINAAVSAGKSKKPPTQPATEAPTYAYAQVRDMLEKANNADAVALAMDSIRFVADELQRVELRELAATLDK